MIEINLSSLCFKDKIIKILEMLGSSLILKKKKMRSVRKPNLN